MTFPMSAGSDKVVSMIKKTWQLLVGKRPESEKNTPLFEYKVSELVGHAIAWMAVRAYKRGDTHMFNHDLAALAAGNSNHSNEAFKLCFVPSDRPLSASERLVIEIPPKEPAK